MIRRRTARRATKRYSARQTCGMAAAGGPSRGTATPRERGSLRPASAKARRDELDQRWPRAPAPSAVSRAPASGRTAGRRTRPRWRTRVRRAGRRTRHPGRPGAGQHGCRRRGGTRTRQQTARSGVSTRRRTGRPQAGTRQIEVSRLGLHNACAEWLLPVLLRSAAEQAPLFALPCFQCIPWLNNSPRSVETVRQAALPIRRNQLEPLTFCKEFVSKLLENIPIVSCIATPTQSRDDINCGKPSPVRAFVHMHYATLTQFMRSPS